MKLIKQIREWFRDRRYDITYYRQRLIRGWADADTWDMDQWFMKTIRPMLKEFRETHVGYPTGSTPKEYDAQLDEMLRLLDIMEDDEAAEKAFEAGETDASNWYDLRNKSAIRFFQLFGDLFFTLWN